LSNAQDFSERQKVSLTADLLRRGATLLNESCRKCGGVQIRFQGRVYCINEDEIPGGPLSTSHSNPVRVTQSTPVVQPVVESRQDRREPSVSTVRASDSQSVSERDSLRKLLEEKLTRVSKQLEDSQDFDQQQKLLDLISKYLETLEKLKKNSSWSP
jgi:uncharacterized Zn finger protein (UPF0148 family)